MHEEGIAYRHLAARDTEPVQKGVEAITSTSGIWFGECNFGAFWKAASLSRRAPALLQHGIGLFPKDYQLDVLQNCDA